MMNSSINVFCKEFLRRGVCRQQVNRFLLNTGQIKSDLFRCLVAEFMGTLLFQIFGGAAPPKDTTAPAANGFALVCISKCLGQQYLQYRLPALCYQLSDSTHIIHPVRSAVQQIMYR